MIGERSGLGQQQQQPPSRSLKGLGDSNHSTGEEGGSVTVILSLLQLRLHSPPPACPFSWPLLCSSSSSSMQNLHPPS